MSKPYFNIAQLHFIRTHKDTMSITELADKCNLFEDQVQNIIKHHVKPESVNEPFSIKGFKQAVQKQEEPKKVTKKKEVPAFLKPKHVPITIETKFIRPAATYNNIQWDEYAENLLKK